VTVILHVAIFFCTFPTAVGQYTHLLDTTKTFLYDKELAEYEIIETINLQFTDNYKESCRKSSFFNFGIANGFILEETVYSDTKQTSTRYASSYIDAATDTLGYKEIREDDNGRLLSIKEYAKTGSQTVLTRSDSFHYSQELLTKFEGNWYNSTDGTLSSTTRAWLTYDQDGSRRSESVWRHFADFTDDPDSSLTIYHPVLNGVEQRDYYQYDYDLSALELYQIRVSSTDQMDSSYILFYDVTGTDTLLKKEYRTVNQNDNNSISTTITYDTEGNITSSAILEIAMTDGNIISIERSIWKANTGKYIPREMTKYSYDPAVLAADALNPLVPESDPSSPSRNMLTGAEYLSFDSESMTYIPRRKIQHHYKVALKTTEDAKALEIQITPNPSDLYIAIPVDVDPLTIRFVAMNGATTTLPHTASRGFIDISNLPAGLYVLLANTCEGRPLIGKFVKK